MYKAYLHSKSKSEEFICSSPNPNICRSIADAETMGRDGFLAIYDENEKLKLFRAIGLTVWESVDALNDHRLMPFVRKIHGFPC